MWLRQKNKIAYLVYTFLAISILLPLLKPGYIFAMDMVFTPRLRWPSEFNFPGAVLYLLNFILPSQIIQKILLFLVLFLGGVGMHKLVPVRNEFAKYFAGIFYIFNPWIYSRFLYGHLYLLIAYALMPFVVKTIFKFLDQINFKIALKLSLWLILIGFISHHFIFMAVLFFVISVLVYILKNLKDLPKILEILKFTTLIGLIFLILSSWWIAPYFNKSSPQGQFIQRSIGLSDLKAFQTEPDAKYGVLLNVLAMYGFWGDRTEQYVVQKDVVRGWFWLFLIILGLVIFGAISKLKEYKAIVLILIGIISFVLSVGFAYPPFRLLINFLNQNLFIFKGFRESQKFSALLVLVYAYFGALGINSIVEGLKVRKLEGLKVRKLESLKMFLLAFLIILPILYSPMMFWGFRGQLSVSDYPSDWFRANEILNQDQDNFKVLFFPWHQYMLFSFTNGKVIANPAPNFFDKPVIAGDNMELAEIYTQSRRPISKFIENEILAKREIINNLGQILKPLSIKYVILVKQEDWQTYGFLDWQTDLKQIYDSKHLKIYQNQSWR